MVAGVEVGFAPGVPNPKDGVPPLGGLPKRPAAGVVVDGLLWPLVEGVEPVFPKLNDMAEGCEGLSLRWVSRRCVAAGRLAGNADYGGRG